MKRGMKPTVVRLRPFTEIDTRIGYTGESFGGTMKSCSESGRRLYVSYLRLAVLMGVAMASSVAGYSGPIHDAARKGDVNKVREILQQDPTQANAKDNNRDTALHVAALHGQVAVAQALLDAGADVNLKNNYGPFLPADLGSQFGTNSHADPVRLLNLKGNDTKYMQNGYTPLDLAIFSTKHKQMVELMVTKGANVNAQAASGATPLFWAVMRDQKDDAQYLLDHGANVNLADAYGDTILDCALHLGFQSLVPLLVDKGADVNAVDQGQHRPLTYAMQADLSSAVSYLKKHGAHE